VLTEPWEWGLLGRLGAAFAEGFGGVQDEGALLVEVGQPSVAQSDGLAFFVRTRTQEVTAGVIIEETSS